MTSSFAAFLDIAPPVRAALAAGAPVVALESTIITHGMPWPQNAAMAAKVEAIIVENGAVPATIAVMDGRLKIGLSADEREQLAQTKGAMKASRADLAFALAERRTAGTTVAATMIAAHRAGIGVFATGGIGGVHRGAETSFDISADLDELARTPVIVVSAGAKAILDLPKTLEMLETRGVPVVGFQTDDFPAFWSRNSGLPVPLRCDSADAIACFQAMRQSLGTDGGMLVANPVPADAEIGRDVMETVISLAQSDADANGVRGKAVTPFLLQRIYELTEGASLKTNIALVENNARLAARIAIEMAQFKQLTA
ncbi:MAG: pseudouridine-5'-phosphate glycosidase [Phyllobacteriaceae bacterium]|nr:pseudouridine-5'-phosphate glycosidase [Phyllobacteriaceae bacterium]